MTTIIIIVVVALVFFVTVCVVTFMVWKREAEMRTDSIRAIESNLEKLGDKLTKDSCRSDTGSETAGLRSMDSFENMEIQRPVQYASRRRPSRDPFDWVRESSEYAEPETSHDETEVISPGDIDAECMSDPESMDCHICTKSTDALQTTENEYYDDTGESGMYPETEEICLPDISDIDAEEVRLPDIEISDFSVDSVDTEEYCIEEHGQEELKAEEPENQMLEKDEPVYDEINLDFEIPQESEYRFDRQEHKPFGHDVGRSGKKYTSEELDVLIKE